MVQGQVFLKGGGGGGGGGPFFLKKKIWQAYNYS